MASISLAVASAPDRSEQPTISPAPTRMTVSECFFLPALEETFGLGEGFAARSCPRAERNVTPNSSKSATSVHIGRDVPNFEFIALRSLLTAARSQNNLESHA